MMDILQSIDPALLPYIGVGCALLCVVVLVIGFVLQAVSGIFEVVLGLFEIAVDIVQGGPIAWCGCGLLIIALAAGAGAIFVMLNAPASCAEHPTQFCLWFGFLQ